ncbi:MAG: hypothetical protein ACE15D_11770 [Candidatus Eisenbacteria bacterium]|nr:hypothetical protein [Candidatus Eisenbacteria bacterium]
MREKLPLTLLIVMGILGLTSRFLPHPNAETFNAYLRDTLLRIISAFALILGLGNLIQHHWHRIRRKGQFWRHSYATLFGLLAVSFIGLFGGVSGDGWLPTQVGGFKYDIQTIYNQMITPLGATLFALLAFYMASAAYRSFRAKNAMAALLLGSAFVVMLGQVPIGEAISPYLPRVSSWIMAVPNTASKRGIDLGVTLGATATLLKILTGIERSWLGGGK